MTTALAAILTFGTVFLAIFALNLVLTDVFRAEQSQRRIKEQPTQRRHQRAALRHELQEQETAAGGLSQLAEQLEKEKELSAWEKFQDFVAQSGLETTASKIGMQSLVFGAIVFALFFLLLRLSVITFVVSALFACFPFLRVAMARSRRLNKIREQLPDTLELIGRVLRAGQTVVQAMNSIGEEYGDPIGGEFARCYEQQNLGLSMEVALKDMARRIGLIEVKIFVLAVLIHRQAGGNLTELLERLAHMVRGRMMLRGEIKSLTAEGRMQALVLIGLPIAVWGALSVLNPDYAFDLLKHPSLVICTLALMMVGAFWINRIVNFDF